MAIELMEAAIDAVKDYLETNMAAKLDVLDAEYSDFELDDIGAYYVAELSAIPEYPSILVLGDFSDIDAEGSGWMHGQHNMTVVALATDQDTERLRRRLYRYIRAVYELLVASRSTIGYSIVFDRLEFSPLYAREGGFLSDARLICKLGKFES